MTKIKISLQSWTKTCWVTRNIKQMKRDREDSLSVWACAQSRLYFVQLKKFKSDDRKWEFHSLLKQWISSNKSHPACVLIDAGDKGIVNNPICTVCIMLYRFKITWGLPSCSIPLTEFLMWCTYCSSSSADSHTSYSVNNPESLKNRTLTLKEKNSQSHSPQNSNKNWPSNILHHHL